jgi:hypothetical protein
VSTKKNKPLLECKILGLIHAWHKACCPVTILNPWRATGVTILSIGNQTFDDDVDILKVSELVNRNCSNAVDKESEESQLP